MTTMTLVDPVAATVLSPQDEPLYEMSNGEHVDIPPMSAYTTWLASRLHGHLWTYTEQHALGTTVTEALCILDTERNIRRRPDVAFVSTQRWPLEQMFPAAGDWNVVPDLAVEVIGPHEVLQDVLAKLREYFHYGVRLVWIVIPEGQYVYVYDSLTQVHILSVGDTLSGDPVVPGFRLPLAGLFQQTVTTPGQRS